MENNIHALHSHSKAEMEIINELIYKTKRQFFLEIGAYHFELSEYFLGRLSNIEGKVVSVDWKNQFKEKCDMLLKSRFFRFIQGDTTNAVTIEAIKKEIGEEKFDIVFIDGGHTYPIVKEDTKNYADLVADDGYIMWHDAYSRIIPFIDELKSQSCPIDIYEDGRGLAYIKGDKWKEWKKSM